MKMFVAFIILILTSFLAPIKVTSQRGGGPSGYSGFPAQPSAGYRGGDHTGGVPTPVTGYMGGQGIPAAGSGHKGSNIGDTSGYRGGSYKGKPGGGGDTGPAIIVIPKKPSKGEGEGEGGGGGGGSSDDIPDFPMPDVCRQDVRECVTKHLYGDVRPRYHGPCCMKFKHSKLCVCKFQTSGIYELSKGAYGVVKGCHFRNTDCPRTY